MFAILAERALGPRLFGVFPQGRLEQYLPSRRLRTEELRDPRVSAEIATTMARFHGMAMPFNKEPKWLFGTMEGYLQQISELSFSEPAQLQQLEQLRGYNLEQEMRSLRSLPPPECPSLSPVTTRPRGAPPGQRSCRAGASVVLSLVSLCLRSPIVSLMGVPLGPGVSLWGRGYPLGPGVSRGCPPGVAARVAAPVSPQLHFIRHYLSVLPGGAGRAPREEQARLEEEMLREIERFTLASHFFWGLWSVVQAKISTIRFGYL
ncbi:CHKA kinase, partial [Motacilla alba]|nr:CHKA kinase [Motacilla alba]